MEADRDAGVGRAPSFARIANVITSVVLAIVAAVFLVSAVTTLSYWDEYGPGPGFIPIWACAGSLLACLWLFVQSVRGAYDGSGDFNLTSSRRSFTYFALVIGSLLLVPVIGLLGAIFLFMLTSMIWVDRMELWRASAFAVGTAIFLYVGLIRVLAVPLPLGMFKDKF